MRIFKKTACVAFLFAAGILLLFFSSSLKNVFAPSTEVIENERFREIDLSREELVAIKAVLNIQGVTVQYDSFRSKFLFHCSAKPTELKPIGQDLPNFDLYFTRSDIDESSLRELEGLLANCQGIYVSKHSPIPQPVVGRFCEQNETQHLSQTTWGDEIVVRHNKVFFCGSS